MNNVPSGSCPGSAGIRLRVVARLLGMGLVVAACTIFPLISLGQEFSALPDETDAAFDVPLIGIEIEGNRTIQADAILERIRSQTGRPISTHQVKEDIKSLYATRWFVSVRSSTRPTANGVILVFHVTERPMIQHVEYRGNKKLKTKYLEELTGLRVGGAYDVSANRESVRRIEAEYKRKGYTFAKVSLVKGNSKDDREVIFDINEGNKVVVRRVKFSGNEAFSDGVLRTRLQTKRAILGLAFLGGKYDPETIHGDIGALKQYYESLGYFDTKFDHRVSLTEARYHPINRGVTYVDIEYFVEEGMRYSVGGIELHGNQIFSEAELKQRFKIKAGDYFSANRLLEDVEFIQDKYGGLGRLFAKVDVDRRFQSRPGVIDLVFQIDEDRVYEIGRINVHILGDNPHTKESVVLNRILVEPGALADPNMIKRSETLLGGQQIFERGPQLGPRVQISPVYEDEVQLADNVFRGQSFDGSVPQPPNPIYQNNPQGDPFGRALQAPPGEVDLDFYVNEARTGRLMFGVGVNSDAGVVGSIVLEENNFDILRPPTSFQDFVNGTAWRGGGQRFRIEAIPGDIVSRYLINWSDPYFLDTDYSLGLSGFYFNRFYPDWDEDRLGGRISLGRQITREISVTGALRLESVELSNPDFPTPPILAASVGNNYLSAFRLSAAHDTRDAPFLPSEGHFVQLSGEQAFGDFVYPRLEAEASQYFTIYRRPDDAGKHILSVFGQVGWTDSQTPIFERYFAGGYQSFRGFEFRGVSPQQFGVQIGGRWMMLGSVQYQMPLTADENIQMVAFTDFGTVENSVSLDQFRVTAGAGLRLTIPAMGPAPIALDWAVPLTKQPFDDTRVFSFYIGLSR